ncbi:integrase [Chromobacterium amazonense]|uniref:Integrase n=1 Tax=Chromobacterium amazonense TaxID=1382803 RepID=A0A2S9X607_9NEIS|nr:integrase arm-type DNA-binding domain-containing protein [Chromobacterium amazonense]PRP71117.1 integrase [Chromobacterium amazonense]
MALTDVKVRQTKPTEKPVKISDSNGLYLLVKPNGSKLWRYKYRMADATGTIRENVYAIGEYPTLSLSEARAERDRARELVKAGRHPSQVRRSEKANQIAENANTFQAVALEWLEKKKASWKPYTYYQASKAIQNNAFPAFGSTPLREVTPAMLLEMLQKMEKRGAETLAIQVRQWCSAVFRYGVATLRADFDPAYALKGALHRPPVNHSRALTVEDIADLKAKLDKYGGNRSTIIAIRLLMYCFTRSAELRKAGWDEFDIVRAEWRIPADRMKMARLHVVPLSRQAIELLNELRRLTGAGDLLFPNQRRPNESMSITTINRALTHMGYSTGAVTGHDFRATASTLLHENGFTALAIERQLAHVERNQVKAAYNHAEYMEERRQMMQWWADYIDAIQPKEIPNVGQAALA